MSGASVWGVSVTPLNSNSIVTSVTTSTVAIVVAIDVAIATQYVAYTQYPLHIHFLQSIIIFQNT